MIANIALVFCLLVSQVMASEIQAFQFSRAVISPKLNQQTLLAVPLDSAVYANSAADFHDLRLIDNAGTITPYFLQKIAGQKTVIRRLPSPSKAPALEKLAEEGISVRLDLEPDAAAVDGLTLITQQHNYEYVLQVLGSDDGQNWQVLLDKALIYDYSRFMNISNRDVDLPSNQFRHFKIVVAQATQPRVAEVMALTRTLHGDEELQRSEKVDVHHQPLHIESIQLWHNQVETVAESEQSFEYPLAGFTISQDEENKITLIDIAAQNQPLTGFKLDIATPNFSRIAELQIPLQKGIETRMQTIASGTLKALRFQDINRQETTLSFPQQRQQHYRLLIHNQDNPALEITHVTGSGPGYALLFLPQTEQSYQLLYGAEKAKIPNYDIAPIQELLRRGYQSLTAGLGPVVEISRQSDGFDFFELLNSKVFLGLVISLMVLVLGWSLFKVAKVL
ncbi:hypothetical protein A1359_05710 [Methylomonas lenta]|uniref:DUF3999 domain-containing protein n=1 Tax=Methylomonas lenta TaxID=980561 RepID=A0A177NIH5_9GAMM|nr:DUF3999 family protein [Methylomonas lenta]OAI17777.1 hypothetical protein A1359_05710 [Methylomonas lenta]